MKINKENLIEFGINIDFDIEFQTLGLVNSDIPDTLTFLDNTKFVDELNLNKNISIVIATKELMSSITDKTLIIVDDPRHAFYSLQNKIYEWNNIRVETKIGINCKIHPTAFIANYNVIIGNNVIIEPNVSILENVEIGDNVIIRAGTVVGSEGFEHKKTSKGILSVTHDGKVIIHNNVHIGSCNAIAKGFAYRNTIIGEDSKTDNLVHIAHGVQIGKRCLFPASCMIAGSVTIEDDVWIGPNASISSQLTIKSGAYITIGSVVTKNAEENEKLTGNFAIPHNLFLADLKKKLN